MRSLNEISENLDVLGNLKLDQPSFLTEMVFLFHGRKFSFQP